MVFAGVAARQEKPAVNTTGATNLRGAVSSPLFAPLALLGLCGIAFADVILGLRRGILSDSTTDLATEFYYWRQFGFASLRHGHIAQWNPHVYGGLPFFAGQQAGLLYPPNWIYLVMPLNAACNLDMMISTYLAGLFMALLARHYGMTPVSQLLCGAIVMLGGMFFPHIFAGHLATLAAMAWTPLILMCVDSLIDRPSVRTSLLAILGFSMQLMAGHPQTVFNTVVMLFGYALIRLALAKRRLLVVATFAAIGACSILMTAVQLLPGVQVASEGVRNHPVGYDFAGEISFQPISLLTYIVPDIFGDILHVAYWGPWNQWELCAFIGIASLPLVVLGAVRGKCPRRGLWICLFVVMTVIAMGQYTPLFKVLYDHAPGFNRFRAYAKFMYPATLFLALLAGAGLDALVCGDCSESANRTVRRIGNATAVLAVVCGFAYMWMLTPLTGIWLIRFMRLGSDSYYHVSHNDFPAFAYQARHFAATGCGIAACTAAVAAAALLGRLPLRRRGWALTAIAILELLVFARSTITTFDPAKTPAAPVLAWLKRHPGDHRVFTAGFLTEAVMGAGGYDVWGYDPMVQRRYSEFVTRSQNQAPQIANMYIGYGFASPALRLLRCCRVFEMKGDIYNYNYRPGARAHAASTYEQPTAIADPMPHASLFYQCRIMKPGRPIIDQVTDRKFPRTRIVVLEKPLPYKLVPPAQPGSVSVIDKGSDTMEVDAVTSSPAVVLITDAYSRFWKATALPGSAQRAYAVMPGDWALIAIPIAAGRHRFELNYCPSAFPLASWISGLTLAAFLVACAATFAPKKPHRSLADGNEDKAAVGAEHAR